MTSLGAYGAGMSIIPATMSHDHSDNQTVLLVSQLINIYLPQNSGSATGRALRHTGRAFALLYCNLALPVVGDL